MEPRDHLARAEKLASLADQHFRNATDPDIDEDTQLTALRYAEAAAQLAQMRFTAAWATFLGADADPAEQIGVQASRARRRAPDGSACWPPRRPS